MRRDRWVKRWQVKSRSSGRVYTVAVDEAGNYGCTCPQWKYRRRICHHIQEIKNNGGGAEMPAAAPRPEVIPAKVLEPRIDGDTGAILVPLIPIEPYDVHMEITICVFMMRHGWSWGETKDRRRLKGNITRAEIEERFKRWGPKMYKPEGVRVENMTPADYHGLEGWDLAQHIKYSWDIEEWEYKRIAAKMNGGDVVSDGTYCYTLSSSGANGKVNSWRLHCLIER